MPEKTSLRTSVWLGFGLCSLLVCAMGMIAFFAVHHQRLFFDRFSEQTEAASCVNRAAWAFNEMQRAAANLRETGDEKYFDLFENTARESVGALDEAARYFHSPENIKLTHMLRKEIEHYLRFNQERSDLEKERQKILREQIEISSGIDLKLNETILAQDRKIEEETKEIEGKRFLPAENVQRRKDSQSVFELLGRCRLFREKMLFAQNEAERSEGMKRYDEQTILLRELLDKLRNESVTQEGRKKFDELIADFSENNVFVLKTSECSREMDRIAVESDQLVLKASETFAHLDDGMEKVRKMLDEETDFVGRKLVVAILAVNIVSLITCIFLGWVVARKVQPKQVDIGFDPYSPSVESPHKNLIVVADKLQEVVDLLRR